MKEYREYLRGCYRERTVSGYLHNVECYVLWCEEEGVSVAESSHSDVMAYAGHLRSLGYSVVTINRHLHSVRKYYQWMVECGLCDENPALDVRVRGGVRRVLHDVVEYHLLEQMYREYPSTSQVHLRNKCIVGMLVYQALTGGELCGLDARDVWLESGSVRIAGRRRSNSRVMALRPEQMVYLQRYVSRVRPVLISERGAESDRFYVGVGQGSSVRRSLEKLACHLRRRYDWFRSISQVRTSVLVQWVREKNLREVQYLAGHRYVSSTERYQRDGVEELKKQLAKYSGSDPSED